MSQGPKQLLLIGMGGKPGRAHAGRHGGKVRRRATTACARSYRCGRAAERAAGAFRRQLSAIRRIGKRPRQESCMLQPRLSRHPKRQAATSGCA
jgi:hypothetical protein